MRRMWSKGFKKEFKKAFNHSAKKRRKWWVELLPKEQGKGLTRRWE